MKRKVQLVVLCEDQQQEAFVRRFLQRTGWQSPIRVERGGGHAFVTARFPRELGAQRRERVTRAVVVMIDGDSVGAAGRLRALNETCDRAGVARRTSEDRVAVFVPTWNIETWLAYLDGATIDEGRHNYPRLALARDCAQHVKVLADMCRAQTLRQPAPLSLQAACAEYSALTEA